MKRPLEIAIVGYGIAGISAAVRLRALDHRVTHFERHDPPVAKGAGMLLHPPALRQLEELGVLDAARSRGAAVRRVTAQTVRGQTLLDISYPELGIGDCGLGIQRGTLHGLLSATDAGRGQVLAGCAIAALDAQSGFLFDKTRRRFGPFDLIIVADGAHSHLRDQLPGLVRHDVHAPTAAVVCLLDDVAGLASDRLGQYFEGARHLSVWPVGDAGPGEPSRCSIAMNMPLQEAATLIENGSWRSRVVQFFPAVGALLEDTESPCPQLFTYRDTELNTCTQGRVVLIGDAAHSMSPQLGMGAQLAMEDAATLVTELAAHGSPVDALRAYSLRRTQKLQRYQRTSRWLTPLFQSDAPLLTLVRNRLMASASNSGAARHFARTLFGQ